MLELRWKAYVAARDLYLGIPNRWECHPASPSGDNADMR